MHRKSASKKSTSKSANRGGASKSASKKSSGSRTAASKGSAARSASKSSSNRGGSSSNRSSASKSSGGRSASNKSASKSQEDHLQVKIARLNLRQTGVALLPKAVHLQVAVVLQKVHLNLHHQEAVHPLQNPVQQTVAAVAAVQRPKVHPAVAAVQPKGHQTGV